MEVIRKYAINTYDCTLNWVLTAKPFKLTSACIKAYAAVTKFTRFGTVSCYVTYEIFIGASVSEPHTCG